MARKTRIDDESRGPSPLQRLKDLPEAEHEAVAELGRTLKQGGVIARIQARHGISGLTEPMLSSYWRWRESQLALRQMNADAEQFRAEFSRGGTTASAEEIHIRTVDYMRLKGLREDDGRLLAHAVAEARKAIELEHSARKLSLLEKKADAAKAVLQDSKLTPEEQRDRLRAILQ